MRSPCVAKPCVDFTTQQRRARCQPPSGIFCLQPRLPLERFRSLGKPPRQALLRSAAPGFSVGFGDDDVEFGTDLYSDDWDDDEAGIELEFGVDEDDEDDEDDDED